MENPDNKEKLRTQLRTLWQDRVMWTRMLLIAIAEDLEGETENILKRLRTNQEDISDALKPYLESYLFCWDDVPGTDSKIFMEFLFMNFGVSLARTGELVNIEKSDDGKTITINSKSGIDSVPVRLNDTKTEANLRLDISGKPYNFKFTAKDVGGRLNIYMDSRENRNLLSTILKNNITMTKNFMVAKKLKSDSLALDSAEALKDNATSIATFLSNATNSEWPYRLIEELMEEYVLILKEEIIAHMNKNNEAGLAASSKLEKHAVKIADVFMEFILKKTG